MRKLVLVCLALLTLTTVTAVATASPQFGAKTDYTTGSTPTSVAIGDLNGDGKPDLALAAQYAYGVSLLMGAGDGSFGAAANVPATGTPYAVVIGDFNANGVPDLATASGTNWASVMLGTGGGAFGAASTWTTGATNRHLATQDVNGDGKLDLVVANYGANSVSVLLGNGDGTFAPKADFTTGSGPYSVAIADLNGDGKRDLAVANLNVHTVSVLLGNGSGGFGTKTDFATGNSPISVTLGDVNADGHPDALVANSGSNTVSVLLGDGSGGLGTKTDFATGSGPYSVALSDFDADGKVDLAVANISSNTVSVLPGNGNGTFGAKADFATGVAPISVAAGDLNADGRPDLAVANVTGNTVSVLLAQAAGSSVALASAPNPSHPGETVTLTATVTPSTATGSVDFLDGASSLGTASLSGGVATLTTSALGFGAHPLSAVYAGDGQVSGSTSPVVFHNVASNPTALTLDSAPNPSVSGQQVVLTASVTPSSATGEVTFYDGGTIVGVSVLTLGQATLHLTTLTVGTHTLHAVYGGDGSNDGSISTSVEQSVTQAPSTVTVTSAPNPSSWGGAVLLTATVTPSTATGSVEFRDAATTIGTGALSGGVATMTTSSLLVGTRYLSAVYGGSSEVSGSVSPQVTHVVTRTPTSVTLSPAVNPSVVGQQVWLTATVTPSASTGTVYFTIGGASFGNAQVSGGQALLPLPALLAGNYSIRAIYTGDAVHDTSSSPVVVQAIHPGPTLVSISSSPSPSHFSESVSVTATVQPAIGAPSAVSGSVQFELDGMPFSPIALSGNAATLTGLTGLSAGTHTFRAVYLGEANYTGSSSATINHLVLSPAPVLIGVRDVANDQGGHVKLLWNASYLDLAPYYAIDAYWVLRSAPATMAASAQRAGGLVVPDAEGAFEPRVGAILAMPSLNANTYWEFLSSQPAFHVPDYSYVAATTCDSLPGSNLRTSFMLMARTLGGAQWWFSNVDSGYSVDNLPPNAPAPFTGTYASGAATLHWSTSADADFATYRLYRGATAGFVPGPTNLVATQPDTGYVDAAGSLAYYKLCAVDVHGNASGFTSLLPTQVTDASGEAVVVFALERVGPNPSRRGALQVAFTLPNGAPARLELLDVSGRRVTDVQVTGAGHHEVALGAGQRVRAGVHFVRLTQGARVANARVVVLE